MLKAQIALWVSQIAFIQFKDTNVVLLSV